MKAEDIKKVLVTGAGTMGHSIAQVFACQGFEVTITARKQTSLDNAAVMIKENLLTLVEARKLSRDQVEPILNRISYTTDLAEAARGAGFVLEAVSEQPELKKEHFAALDRLLPPETVIASTTSGLNIFELAGISFKNRLVIHHWFTPAYIVPLVEIVPGPDTDKKVIDFSVSLIKLIKRKPVVMKKFVPSFIVNRIQNAVLAEVIKMVGSGWATPEQIDEAVKLSLGIRLPIVGLFQSLDFNGIDTVYDILKAKFGEENVPPMIKEPYNAGHLGAKTGKGIYDYGERSPKEIIKKRDLKFLEMLDKLEQMNAFESL